MLQVYRSVLSSTQKEESPSHSRDEILNFFQVLISLKQITLIDLCPFTRSRGAPLPQKYDSVSSLNQD